MDQGPFRRRAMLFAAVVSMAGLALVMVLAGSFAATGVAENASELHRANATAGSLALSRAALSQAIIFGADHELGLVPAEDLNIALDQARFAVTDLEQWTARFPESDPLRLRLDSVIAGSYRVIDSVTASSPDDAAAAFATIESDAASALLDLQYLQARALDDIRTTEGVAGWVGLLARIGVTLIIPIAALLIHRQLVRRRFAEAKIRLDADREAQQAKEQFIAGISHELRSPLTSIYGFSAVMAETVTDPEIAEMAVTVRAESAELSRMVEDLIAFAHVQSEPRPLRVETFPVDQVIRAVIEPYAQREPSIRVEADTVDLTSDRDAVEHVVRNLVSNAHRHGGTHLLLQVRREERSVRFTISDDGPVFDQAVIRGAMSGPFRHDGKAALTKGSVGLGLTIAVTLAAVLGGRIEFRRLATWTQFSLVVPGAQAEFVEAAA